MVVGVGFPASVRVRDAGDPAPGIQLKFRVVLLTIGNAGDIAETVISIGLEGLFLFPVVNGALSSSKVILIV